MPFKLLKLIDYQSRAMLKKTLFHLYTPLENKYLHCLYMNAQMI